MPDDAIARGRRPEDGEPTSDSELLRRYAEEKSEAAFAELVQRHLGLVYSAALRQVGGDAHHAQDVAQTVFTTLARNAAAVARHPVLIGWLYTTTQHVAAKIRRAEGRRHAREHQAHLMHELTSPDSPAVEWEQLRPVLDDAMRELSDRDREAVLLRFFAQRPFAEIGATLHLSEDAARMRVERALDKLHALLAKRGIDSTATALGLALAQGGVVAAPAGLASVVAGAALSGAAMGGGVATAGLFAFMSTNYMAPASAMMAAAIAVGAAAYSVQQSHVTDRELAAAENRRATALARLERMRRGAESLANITAESPGAVSVPIVRPSIRLPDSEDTQMRMAAGREFLARHPEVKPILEARERHSFEITYGAKLRALGLSPEERARIAAASEGATQTRMHIGGVIFELGSIAENPFDSPGGKLAELLGPENYQRYVALQTQERANAAVKAVAVAACSSDTPLLPVQAAGLTALIAQHTQVRQSTPGWTVFALDWKAIAADAAGVLSPPQLELFNAAMKRNAPASVTQQGSRR